MEKKLMNNVIESATLVGFSAGAGLIAKKVFKIDLTSNPTSSVMDAAQWVVVLLGAIYARDYLIKEKILPTT